MGQNSARPWFLERKTGGESCCGGAVSWPPYCEGSGAQTVYTVCLGLRLPSCRREASLTTH